MATDTMTSPMSIASHIIPGGEHNSANHAEYTLEDEGDNRSSSLSDLGERATHNEAGHDIRDLSDANDTEAETERLEDSPQKLRKHQNVAWTTANSANDECQSPLAKSTLEKVQKFGPSPDMDPLEATSEISSLADSADENDDPEASILYSPRKRKISSVEEYSPMDREALQEPLPKSTKLFRNSSAGTLIEAASPNESGEEDEEEEDQILDATAPMPAPESRMGRSPETTLSEQEKQRQGKRKGREVCGDDPKSADRESLEGGSPAKHVQHLDVISSSDEEGENDDAGDAPEVDQVMKAEEGAERKTALNALNAMEKCFATLRDKLFDERLIQCNEELAMLESPIPTHPELIAMKNVIDQRRDQKLHYEQNLMKYKLQSLQRESVANKAQGLSQYMQTAREIRDSHMDKLNEKCHQLQRERRNAEEDVPDYMFTFPTKRSQQITQQTAYNTEVSILSGVAKYVGFPAAPEIRTARPKEIEDDLRNMGIPTQISQGAQKQPPPLRHMASSNFARHRTDADEQFREQNPWANPQHPSHQHRHQLHRQVSALSRTTTPSSTPVNQRRPLESAELQGSASTIPDHPSAPNSSIVATPATGETTKLAKLGQIPLQDRKVDDPAPSRVVGQPAVTMPIDLASYETPSAHNKVSQPNKPNQRGSPSMTKNASQEIQTPNSLPKPLPFMSTGGTAATPVPRTSTPGKYPLIKNEDHGPLGRNSPMPRYNTPPINAVLSAPVN